MMWLEIVAKYHETSVETTLSHILRCVITAGLLYFYERTLSCQSTLHHVMLHDTVFNMTKIIFILLHVTFIAFHLFIFYTHTQNCLHTGMCVYLKDLPYKKSIDHIIICLMYVFIW